MTIHWALHDPASWQTSDNSYWVGRTPELDRALLDRLYYEFAQSRGPGSPGPGRTGSQIAGVVQLTPDWVGLFRFEDCGRDANGRPGRMVMLASLAATQEAITADLASTLFDRVPDELFQRTREHCPIRTGRPQTSPALPLRELADPDLGKRVLQVFQQGSVQWTGPDALAQAGALCARLAQSRADRVWICDITRETGSTTVRVECPEVMSTPSVEKRQNPFRPPLDQRLKPPSPRPAIPQNHGTDQKHRLRWNPGVKELLGLLAVFQGMALILLFVLIRQMADLPTPSNAIPAPLTSPAVQAIDSTTRPNKQRPAPETVTRIQAIIDQLQEVQRQLSEQTPERKN